VRRATQSSLRRSLLSGLALLLVWAFSVVTLHPISMAFAGMGAYRSFSSLSMQHGSSPHQSNQSKKPVHRHSSTKHCEFCFASNTIAPPAPPRVAYPLALVTRLESRITPHFPNAIQSLKKARAPPFQT
jgi:hypothetical protein